MLIGNVSEIKPLKEQPGWDGAKPVAVSCVCVNGNTFYAYEDVASPYVLVCPGCGERLVHKIYKYDVERYVTKCSNHNQMHRHIDHVVERGYYCITNTCPAIGYYLDKTITVSSTTCTKE